MHTIFLRFSIEIFVKRRKSVKIMAVKNRNIYFTKKYLLNLCQCLTNFSTILTIIFLFNSEVDNCVAKFVIDRDADASFRYLKTGKYITKI